MDRVLTIGHSTPFLGVNYPTDYFSRVEATIKCKQDEHKAISEKTFKTLQEIFRVVDQKVECIIRFHFPSIGINTLHDDKHIQLERTLTDLGFCIEDGRWEAATTLIFRLVKPVQVRTKILFPPGMGDCYWTIVKIESFIQTHGITIPDIQVICDYDNETKTHSRAHEFIEMFPFLHATGITVVTGVDGERRKMVAEAFGEDGETIFTNVVGNNYFMGFNGPMHAGRTLEEIHPEYECNWKPAMYIAPEQIEYEQQCKEKYGKYIVCYFSFVGTFAYWEEHLSVAEVAGLVNEVFRVTGCVPIFAGSSWDRDADEKLSQLVAAVPGCIDLRGETTLQEAFGLIKGSQLVIGYPTGLTIMAGALGLKTSLLWDEFYDQRHWWNVVPLFTHDKTYFVENVDGADPGQFATRAAGIINAT